MLFISAIVTFRPFEVIEFGSNRKRVCDFLLVRNSNLGPILHHFGDRLMTAFMCSWPHIYSTVILGCSRCTRPLLLGSVRAGTLSYSAVQLFSKYSNLCENHGQTTCNLITALCVASRGNKRYISAYTLSF